MEIDPSGYEKFAEIRPGSHWPSFSYVIAGLNGFQRVAVLRIGSVQKAAVHNSRRSIFGYFFIFLAPTVRLPLFKRCAHTHRKMDSSFYIY